MSTPVSLEDGISQLTVRVADEFKAVRTEMTGIGGTNNPNLFIQQAEPVLANGSSALWLKTNPDGTMSLWLKEVAL